MKLKECPFCGSDAELEEDRNIFHGQNYSDRYSPDVARQDHGYKIRCVKCGCQTCWWHYKREAIEAWRKRHLTNSSSRAAECCACSKPTILEKSYCTQCGRDMYPPPA